MERSKGAHEVLGRSVDSNCYTEPEATTALIESFREKAGLGESDVRRQF